MKEEKLCFVQFLHPGSEHSPGSNDIMPWNEGNHKRKFMLTNGRYVSKEQDTPKEGKITFWGEWEAPSKPTPLIPNSEQKEMGYPEYLQEPILEEVPKDFKKLQNTDPYVFGEKFLYIGCQQATKDYATQLRYLKKGSVILFGSCKNNKFILDTVFVVKDYVDHDAIDYETVLKDRVSDVYWHVTVLPWYKAGCEGSGCGKEDKTPACGNKKHTYRLYFGATYNDRENGMFSFFPCDPGSNKNGFPRPVIEIDEIITDDMNQKFHYKRKGPEDPIKVKENWQQVVDQVVESGLALGIYAEEPSFQK